MNKKPKDYSDLLKNAWQFTDIEITDTNADLEINGHLDNFRQNIGFSNLNNTVFYLLDYVKSKYLYVGPGNNNFLKCNLDYLTDAGPLYYTGLWHPKDFKTYCQYFNTNMHFAKQYSLEELKQLVFTTNYRIKNKYGDYIHLIQRSSYLKVSANGTPLAVIGSVTDITLFKETNRILHTIEKFNGENTFSRTPIFKQYYYPEEEEGILSSREKEILKMVCDGLNSNQIADKVHLSHHTVKQHRKNMLEKTNCKNASELLHYAIKNNLI